MQLLRLLIMIFFNVTAWYYAVCIACIVSPLYVFLVKPRVDRVVAARHPAQPPVQLASLVTMPQEWTCRTEHPAPPTPRKSPFASPIALAPPPSPAPSTRASSALAAVSPHDTPRRSQQSRSSHLSPQHRGGSPAARLFTALHRRYHERRELFFGRSRSKCSDDGNANYQPAHPVLQQNHLAEVFYKRRQRFELYDKMNITEAALEQLYSSDAFQQWYAENREECLRDVALRRSCRCWASVATCTMVLFVCTTVPAYNFSTTAVLSSSTFAGLLKSRLSYIMTERQMASHFVAPLPYGAGAVQYLLNSTEYLLILLSACMLLYSCFLSDRCRSTAVMVVVSVLLLILESGVGTGAGVHLGLGLLFLMAVAVRSIYSASK